jgi:hypothetical protein
MSPGRADPRCLGILCLGRARLGAVREVTRQSATRPLEARGYFGATVSPNVAHTSRPGYLPMVRNEDRLFYEHDRCEWLRAGALRVVGWKAAL